MKKGKSRSQNGPNGVIKGKTGKAGTDRRRSNRDLDACAPESVKGGLQETQKKGFSQVERRGKKRMGGD